MNKTGSAAKVRLNSFDDLFGRMDEQRTTLEQVINVPLTELYEFNNHPFRVVEDEKMKELAESIQQYGVLNPGIVRPRVQGGYEIISGHRRKYGCELAGLEEMPVFVRNYSDEEAIVIMVDSNIQREDILPGEKARAYRMKYEAMKHQGKGMGKLTFDEIGEAAGESGKTVQRYIWLSRLNDELLDMIDKKRLGIVQGINLSFLTEEQQNWVTDFLLEEHLKVGKEQSEVLKLNGRAGRLTRQMVGTILEKENTGKQEPSKKIMIKQDVLSRYFPESYTQAEIKEVIFQLLDNWKKTNE